MIMARNNSTSVDFWLNQSFSSLLRWIETNNRLNKQQK